MIDIRIQLSGMWVALMLTYLLGDVVRLYAGDFKPGQIGGMQISQGMYLAMTVIMLIPILMVIFSLTLDHSVNRWVNIIAAVGMFIFNLIGLPSYPSLYDKFLIVVGLIFNAVTVWNAWNWV